MMLDKLTIGSWITLAHPSIAEIMAKAGFDWLAVDLEHSSITIREAEELIRVINLCGVVPLVRLTSNDSNQIKRVMDSGAHGVIVPMVNDSNDAINAVEAVKYPPTGKRGVGLARAHGYGETFNDYLAWQDQGSLVIAQIEHIKAVENLEEIISVEGVNGYIVGPYDLSASMGIPGDFQHSDFKDAMKEINRIAEKLNVPGGVHIVEPDPAELFQKIEEGLKFIAYSLDTRMLATACVEGINHSRKNEV